jgi:hypothetical protein
LPAATSLAALGSSLARIGRHSEAVVSLAAAAGLGEVTVALRIRLAIEIGESGDRPEALRRLWDLWRAFPNDPEVQLELMRLLSDPQALTRIANRQQILEEIRAALPELRLTEKDSLLEALAKVGKYISAWAAAPADPGRLERAFRFLDHLAENPDPEVADLLTAVVFPTFAGWSSPVEAARAMLGGRAQRVLNDALALWGPPLPGDPPLVNEDLLDKLRVRLTGFDGPEGASESIGAALGRHYITVIESDTPSGEIERVGLMLSRMAESGDAMVREAFGDALEEMLAAGSSAVLRAAQRTFSGIASTALENQAGRDQLR